MDPGLRGCAMQPPAGAALRALLAASKVQTCKASSSPAVGCAPAARAGTDGPCPTGTASAACRSSAAVGGAPTFSHHLLCCNYLRTTRLKSRCPTPVGCGPTVTCAANRLEMGCKDHKKACERINRRCDCVSESHSTPTLTDAAFKQTFKREGASEYCARAPGWRHRRATCAADSAAASPSSGTCGSMLIPSAVPAETGAIPAICTAFESRGGTFFLKYILVDRTCSTFMYNVV